MCTRCNVQGAGFTRCSVQYASRCVLPGVLLGVLNAAAGEGAAGGFFNGTTPATPATAPPLLWSRVLVIGGAGEGAGEVTGGAGEAAGGAGRAVGEMVTACLVGDFSRESNRMSFWIFLTRGETWGRKEMIVIFMVFGYIGPLKQTAANSSHLQRFSKEHRGDGDDDDDNHDDGQTLLVFLGFGGDTERRVDSTIGRPGGGRHQSS